jgi:hypothetical protein
MKLKEKFKNVNDEGKTWNQIYEQQEQIADDYAIDFAHFLAEHNYSCYKSGGVIFL